MKGKKMIIRAITKNSKGVFDKYTVYFWDGSCLTLSSNPDNPQGFSQMGEYFAINDLDFEQAALENKKINSCETLINFFDLPQIVQSHIEKRINMKD